MRPLVTVFAVIAMLALALPMASSLVPGAYRLQWNAPDYESDFYSIDFDVEIIRPADAARFGGLISTQARWGTQGHRYLVVLDESRGTGKGYDVLYLLITPPPEGHIDLSQATRIPLMRDNEDDELVPTDEAVDYLVDLPLGPEGLGVTKQAAVDVTVSLASDGPDAGEPESVSLVLRGGWYGSIKTDAGSLRVMTIDNDYNGIYNDVGGEEFSGDGVLLLRKSREYSYPQMLGTVGRVAFVDGELYTISVSAVGDTVEVKPYDGPAGTIRIKATDSAGRFANCESLTLNGSAGTFEFDTSRSSEFRVPVGEYGDVKAYLPFTNGRDVRDWMSISVSKSTPVRIADGQVSEVTVGGPMTLKISPDVESVTAKRGSEVRLSLAFAIGDDDASVSSRRQVAVNIRDASGKLLISTKAEFG